MKRWIKCLIIVGGALFAAGVLTWIIGMSVLGWDFKKLDSTEYTAKTYAAMPENEISRVELSVNSFPVVVSRGDGVKLDYYEASNSEVSVTDDGGVLKITENYRANLFKSGVFGFGRSAHKYALTVGSGVQIDVKSGNGSVTFDGLEFEQFDLDVSNADIVFKNCSIDRLDIASSNADIEIIDCVLGDTVIDVTNCNIDIVRTAGDGLDVKSTNLDAVMERAEFATAALDGTNIDAAVVGGEFGRLGVFGTNVDIDVKTVVVAELEMRSTNLDADIRISGVRDEYTVETSGREMPTNRIGTTEKKIKLSGTNNDVSLEFV